MPQDERETTRPTPAQYQERDLAILRHIERYGVGMLAAINHLFMAKHGNAGHILRRLSAAGLVASEGRKLPGNHSYATLTRAGYAKLGRDKKPRALSGTSLDQALAILYWCVLANEKTRRFRLSPRQVTELFPDGGCAPNVPHVITEEFGIPAVLRVYLAGAGKLCTVTKNVRQFFEQSRCDKRLLHLVAQQELGLLVLASTRERATQLQKSLVKGKEFADVRLVVGVGATSTTLGPLLRKKEK